ncbi:MAG: PorT family protein [Tannerella sp.]|nr:PorT family protein [Tannerella sp.]
MKLMVIGIGTMLLFCFPANLLRAQGTFPHWEYKINVGANLGGTSPLPLPEEIREIETFSPQIFAPHVALEVTRRLTKKWGVSAQIALDYKGFSVDDRVKNLYTEIEMSDEKYTGSFTGKNNTRIHNSYITIPLAATCRIAKRWEVQAGVYVGYLYGSSFKGTASDGYIRQGSPVGEKTNVEQASFDFSDKQNLFDYGLSGAGEWAFSTRFALRGQIAWGLNPLFPSDFTGVPFRMYNIYGTLGMSYRLHTDRL